MKAVTVKKLVGIALMLFGMNAFACNHFPIFVNHTDETISVAYNGPHSETKTVAPNASVNGIGQCTGGWYNILSIDGLTKYAPYFTVSQSTIDDTAQVFTINPGPKYGTDYPLTQGDYTVAAISHETIANTPVIKVVPGAGSQVISCGAGDNDGVAYMLADSDLYKTSADQLTSAFVSGQTVHVDIKQQLFNLPTKQVAYCVMTDFNTQPSAK